MRRVFTTGLIVVVIALSAYFGSYFLLVRPGTADAQNGTWGRMAVYRFGAEPGLFDPRIFYRFAHSVDNRFLRPSLWSGTYNPLAIMAADLGITNALKPMVQTRR
jgi:hypothetical protein